MPIRLRIGLVVFFVTCLALASTAGAQPINACGTLVSGVNQCVLFDIGGGTRYLLDDHGGHAVGDTFRVVGTLQPTCFSVCNQGNGCVTVSSITTCATVAPPPSVPGDRRCGLCGIGLPATMTPVIAAWLARRARRRR